MKIRYPVLFLPLVPLLGFVGLALADPVGLVAWAQRQSDWVLDHFDWLFSWSIFACLLTVVAVYVSPLGRVRIGGPAATPLLSPYRWFAVTVCTTIATGILFWGTAEPLYHVTDTPAAGRAAPEVFAMSTLFLHWTLTPYGMYTLSGLLFALVFYNRGGPFALESLLEPLGGASLPRFVGTATDALCLFALVAGMAASLGAGSLSLLGGLGGVEGPGGLAVVILAIVVAFSISAASGLQRGIRILSFWNVLGFMVLAVFVLVAGPTGEALELGGRAAVDYFGTFLPRNLGLDPAIPRAWRQDWTAFYWANWYAWAPITGLFLGRLGRGYTVRRFIRVNLLYTSLFGAFWMICFGAVALVTNADGSLATALAEGGPQAVIYALLDQLPLARYTPPLFLLLVFLSYVTAADSNVSAMSALCVEGLPADATEAPLGVKLLWGLVIGAVAWILVAFAGLDGIRIISTLGGFPAMLLLILAALGLLRLAFGGKSSAGPPGTGAATIPPRPR